MDTAVTIIGVIIAIIIGIPLYFVFRSNAVNKKQIKAIFNQHPSYNFKQNEEKNKKVLAIDEIKKGFLLIDLNSGIAKTSFINLKEVHSCHLVRTTAAHSNTVVKIEFEFQYRDNNRKVLVPFYNIDDDQIGQVYVYEENQLAEKWEKIIQDCISRTNV